ncbi:hypothetical protein Tsubulata_018460 [Turnera subulata]|uniref:Protein kinase domain-containing protein n=1 Tax=Turnera subulata TaxID=218843 RepID=A0A9Q0GH80_9ROSI|nr:hypothetical protein Tsubulata_018460 [Turnera subulata]
MFTLFFHSTASICSSQKTCPNCGSIQVPYPLSTNPNCGDPNYHLRCDFQSQKLFFNALNGSSYLVLRIRAPFQRMVVQPAPWVSTSCVTQDAVVSEGLALNQSLPFNVTSSNTVFFFNCSPRIFLSPLNCSPSNLCYRYLESSGHLDTNRALQCASGSDPCCSFVAGGMPSAYRIRLHSSGCRAFRSIVHLNPDQPANQWAEGLEIQWSSPPEPICTSQLDCSGASKCSPAAGDSSGVSRCLCLQGYYWDHVNGTCSRIRKRESKAGLMSLIVGLICFSVMVAGTIISCMYYYYKHYSKQGKMARARESMLKAADLGNYAKLYHLKEVKKATKNFSQDRFLGSGGFGQVYRGELRDGTLVAIKSARVGSIKSTEQLLNEVGILSQINHKNLVKLLGFCLEAAQPLLIYEFIRNGTLHDHLQRKRTTFLGWRKRLRIAWQTSEALAYLHSGVTTPIYHRDVKSTNILLDEDFNAKVSDFGLSRLALPGLSHVSTCAQGTVGYLDPEYYRTYKLNDKSDVYSFGVVLLELLTSQMPIDFTRDEAEVNIVVFVNQRANNGAIMEVVDQRLLGEDPSSDVLKSVHLFSELAFACLMEKKVDRPAMKDVAKQLECIILILGDEEKFLDEISVVTL